VTGKMLRQARQGRIDTNVTSRGRGIIEKPCGYRHPVAAYGTPVVVEELHQAAIRAAEPTVVGKLSCRPPSGVGCGPEHHAASLRPKPLAAGWRKIQSSPWRANDIGLRPSGGGFRRSCTQ